MSELYRYHYPFFSENLKIEFTKKVSKQITDEIGIYLQDVISELNQTKASSSAHLFLNSGISFPIKLKPIFYEFLNTNIDYFFATKGNFNPFNIEINLENIDDYIYFDSKDLIVIKKKKNFKLLNDLKKLFVIQKLVNYLNILKITDFHISYIDFCATFGKVTWNAKFNLDNNQKIAFTQNNSFAYIFHPKKNPATEIYNKFANVDQEIEPLYIVLIGKHLLDLKILSLELIGLKWKHQYVNFAKHNSIDLIIYTKDLELFEI